MLLIIAHFCTFNLSILCAMKFLLGKQDHFFCPFQQNEKHLDYLFSKCFLILSYLYLKSTLFSMKLLCKFPLIYLYQKNILPYYLFQSYILSQVSFRSYDPIFSNSCCTIFKQFLITIHLSTTRRNKFNHPLRSAITPFIRNLIFVTDNRYIRLDIIFIFFIQE